MVSLPPTSRWSDSQNFDPTSLVTPPGRKFLLLRGGPLGKELADNYEAILKETGVTGYPFVRATETGLPPGHASSPTGRRLDAGKLLCQQGVQQKPFLRRQRPLHDATSQPAFSMTSRAASSMGLLWVETWKSRIAARSVRR